MNQAYLLGRLMAALVQQEAMQPTAWQGDPKVLTAAIAKAKNLDQLAPLMEAIEPEMLTTKMPLDAESDFWVGYYHQRKELHDGGRVSPIRPGREAKLEERWEIRLDTELKAWALANGGSELVRTLLREEKERKS